MFFFFSGAIAREITRVTLYKKIEYFHRRQSFYKMPPNSVNTVAAAGAINDTQKDGNKIIRVGKKNTLRDPGYAAFFQSGGGDEDYYGMCGVKREWEQQQKPQKVRLQYGSANNRCSLPIIN